MLSTLQHPSLIESEIKESRKKTLAQEKILSLSTSLCSNCAYLKGVTVLTATYLEIK